MLETAERGLVRTRKELPSQGDSLSGDSRGRDLFGHRKNPTEHVTLTSWRRSRERQVGTWKESDRAKVTHLLEMAEGGTFQDMERKRASERHPPSDDGRGRDLSGTGKQATH